MRVTVVCVGKAHDVTIREAVVLYQNRLQRVLPIEWRIIPPSTFDEHKARDIESAAILNALKPDDIVWLLDERGEQITSPALSSKLNDAKVHGAGRLVVIIGGAYGVNDSLRNRANWVWSLSQLVFPHQLVRHILVEQLYRATEIERGSRYHHV